MNRPSPLQRYVTHLVDWARDGPEDRVRIRAVMHPAGEIWPWIDGVIAPLYWRSLQHARGMTRTQFRDECRERLFFWIKSNVAEMEAPDFSDENMRKVIAKIARNTRNDIWREMKRARLESLEAYLENRPPGAADASNGPRPMPENLQTASAEDEVMKTMARAEEARVAAELLPHFHRALRSRPKLRALLAVWYRLGRSEGKREKFSAHWYVWRLLRAPKGTQLPQYIREILRARWPEVDYGVLNARVRCVRAALTNFLLQL